MKIRFRYVGAGAFLLETRNGDSHLVQTDWDYPGLASSFGWTPCDCGTTDGTIDCDHRTASEMIAEARAFLEANEGMVIDDPGYFEYQSWR